MANIKEYKVHNYFGMNNSKDSSEIKTGEASLIENFLVSTAGKLKRRPGLTLIGTDSDNNTGLGLTHYTNGAVKVQIKIESTVIKMLSGDSWSTMSGSGATGLTSGLDMNFVAANNFLYGFNGTDTVRKVNNTGAITISNIPIGKWGVWWRNYLFVGGVSAYPNRIYFSNIGDPETFSVNDYIDIEPGDGDYLTGAIGGTDKLVISKNHSFHYLTGAGSDTFAIYPIPVDFGCPSFRSLVKVNTDFWCIDTEGRIRAIARSMYGLMIGRDMSSDYIQGTIDTINKAALSKTVSFYINGYVGFAVPTGSSTVNNLVMVFDNYAQIPDTFSRWVMFTGWNPSDFDIMSSATEDTLYVQSNQAVSDVYSWSGNTDNGTNITSTWIGANVSDDSPGIRKRNLYLKWFGFPLGDYNADIYCSIDRNTFTNIGSLNLTNLGSTWSTGVWGKFVWGTVGNVVKKIHYSTNNNKVIGKYRQLKLVYSSNSDPCEIGTMVSYYKTLRFRL